MIWDIETSPCVGTFWRAGKMNWLDAANIDRESDIICICWKWEGSKKVYTLRWDKGDSREMLIAFRAEVEKADEMVAHNGDRFDIKWFNTMLLRHGLEPLPMRKTVDTLKIAKRYFNFNSNALGYLVKLLFGEEKKGPGLQCWLDILFRNCPKAMRVMTKYCAADVILLEMVYNRLADFAAPTTHVGVLNGGEKWSCAHCASENVGRNQKRVTAMGTPQHTMRCKDCNRYYLISNSEYTKFVLATHKGGSQV